MKWLLALASTVLFAQQWPQLGLSPVAAGLQNLTDVAAPPDGSGRLFLLEQRGNIRIFKNGALLAEPFLNWTSRVSCCGERGLLGIAFPPGFATKQYFYINYTDTDGNTVVSRLRVSTDADRADAASEQPVLRITQPFSNHNGGGLAFGPDGFLYIGTGDGGSGGDPQNNGQRTDTLLGKMLRIDTESGATTYTVPPSNPFVNQSAYRAEIWATGLRNPWRYSFDRETGDLWIADVGQNRAEEVNFQPAASRGGENYGWRTMEGLQCLNASASCNREGLTLPVVEYGRNLGISVTGGFVYRGARFPALRGIYLYADFGSGRIWGIRRSGNTWENRELLDTEHQISTFGQDEAGEIYVGTYGGSVLLVTAGAPAISADRVVNAASFGPGLVPGSLATVFGTGITSVAGIVQATQFPLPTELSGASVMLNGTRVPVLAVANVDGQEQINFQIPFDAAPTAAASLVVTANGRSSPPVQVAITAAQPEIFAVTRTGGIITIWATGMGAVTNAPATGQAAPMSPLAVTLAQTQVTVNGILAADVTYSGLAPGFAGLYQINAVSGESGDVVLRVGSAVSRPWRLSAP